MSVGKFSLISQYVKRQFPDSPFPTIGIEFTTKVIKLHNGELIKAQIWDTAGQEKYKSITSHHYRRAVGALLVYDITRRNTFDDCLKWYAELKNYTEKECVICIVGNKSDLADGNPNRREVTKEEGKSFSIKNNTLFFETSAKKFETVNNCFGQLIQFIYDQRKKAFNGNDSMTSSFIIKQNMLKKNEETDSFCC